MGHPSSMLRVPCSHGQSSFRPEAVCTAASPRDLNSLLIAYEGKSAVSQPGFQLTIPTGGVVLWDIKQRMMVKTFEMVLPPGSPGGSSYMDPVSPSPSFLLSALSLTRPQAIWAERTPPVTSIAWHPDGTAFVVGHEDGCLAFWALDDPDKPLLVRTIEREDVNVTDAESLFDAGALDSQARRKGEAGERAGEREPIFKVSWVSFPDEASLKALLSAQGQPGAGEPVSGATIEYAERGESVLVVLGGCVVGAAPAIHLLQMPALVQPVQAQAAGMEGLSLAQRNAFRESLSVTGVTTYPSTTPAEDFILVPRSSPYFNLCHDPIAIVIFLTPDPSLPPIQGMHGVRSVDAWEFPPPRSDVVPEDTGRKKFRTVEDEVHGLVPMTAAPVSPAFRGGRSLSTVTSPGGSPWRMPWTPPPAASPNPFFTPSGVPLRARPPRPFRLPSLFWTGRTNVLGCEIYPLANEVFTKLISWSITLQDREKPRLPGLTGGMAVPDLSSPNAPDPGIVKMESYRVLVTYSADGCVRYVVVVVVGFADWLAQVLGYKPAYSCAADAAEVRISESSAALDNLPIDHSTTPLDVKSSPRTAIPIGSNKSPNHRRRTRQAEPRTRDTHADGGSPRVQVWRSRCPTGRERAYSDSYRCWVFPSGREKGGTYPGVDEYLASGELEVGWVQAGDGVDDAAWAGSGFGHVRYRQVPVVIEGSCTDALTGFLAVAYASKSVIIVDLRGPDVILREGFTEEGLRVKKKKKGSQNVPADSSQCLTVKWTICRLGQDHGLAPRLVLSYARG